jgi:hypothetical protein
LFQMDVSLLPSLSLFLSPLGFPLPYLSLPPPPLSHGFSPTPPLIYTFYIFSLSFKNF